MVCAQLWAHFLCSAREPSFAYILIHISATTGVHLLLAVVVGAACLSAGFIVLRIAARKCHRRTSNPLTRSKANPNKKYKIQFYYVNEQNVIAKPSHMSRAITVVHIVASALAVFLIREEDASARICFYDGKCRQ